MTMVHCNINVIIPDAPYLLKSHWSAFRQCCPQHYVLCICCEDWCYNMAARRHPLPCVVVILHIGPDVAYRIDHRWIDWPYKWCWWHRNVRHYHNKYTAKIKGAARLRDVTPRLLVNPTFRWNLVTLSSRDQAAQWEQTLLHSVTNKHEAPFVWNVGSVTDHQHRQQNRWKIFLFRKYVRFLGHFVWDLWCTR